MGSHTYANTQTDRQKEVTNQQGKSNKVKQKIVKIVNFYYEGFRNMTIGRSLWVLIIIKLFIMFAILKLFFFPDKLETEYSTDVERADAVRSTLMK